MLTCTGCRDQILGEREPPHRLIIPVGWYGDINLVVAPISTRLRSAPIRGRTKARAASYSSAFSTWVHLLGHVSRPGLCHLKQSPKRDREEARRATAVTTDLSTKSGSTLFCGLLAEALMSISAYLPSTGHKQNKPISSRGPPLF